MAALDNVDISGKSGTKYSFQVYPFDQAFNRVGAVYAILRRERDPKNETMWRYSPVYVGETSSLLSGFYDHPKEPCFEKEDANCVAVHLDNSEESRKAKEQDILDEGVWPCNGKALG
jgi:hypothetical protein